MHRRALLTAATALAAWQFWPRNRAPLSYATPLAPPGKPLKTYHLGHSLVGRDMPAMLAQLAGHIYHSQLGWGASLQDHWQGSVKGFAEENGHAAHLPARAALQSGSYDAVILTEMIDLADAIRWHNSAANLTNWASLARTANPQTRIYLYETWHPLTDPAAWAARIDTDLATLWEADLLAPALRPIYMIPGGQVMAAAARAAQAGRLAGLTGPQDFLADDIHLNDLGAWLIATTHFATLYHRPPMGLPARLMRADGTQATPPNPDTALVLQKLVWQVVTGYPATGVAQAQA